MASRIIHLAITDRISQKYSCKDKNRLELGSVLPDAAVSGNSHLKVGISGGTKKTYDLTGFRSGFLAEMLRDDLYLGYYLHLVQDLYFRDYVYRRCHWDPSPPGNVERLHHDYALINRYVIQKYALSDTIAVPALFGEEPINKLGCFSVCELLTDMKTDFQSRPAGIIFFFTKEMADEFISYACEKCEQEINAVFHNPINCLDEKALAWPKR